MNKADSFLKKENKTNQSYSFIAKLILIIVTVTIMSLDKGLINVTYKFLTSLNVEQKDFKDTLSALNMNDYTMPENISAEGRKKNIIIISLESFEKGYFSPKYEHLTPHLSSLKKDSNWTYFNMNQNEGSQWTSGSLYTYLTGFPAFFGTFHNNIFQSSYHSNITSIGHVLKKLNYTSTYIVSDSKHSGTDDMLNALKIDNIIDKVVLNDKSQDLDLFEAAKKTVSSSISKENPFALFISTLSTHAPNGIYDERMEKHLPKQANELEFMASAVDFMLNDFINYLKEKNLLENTVVYIFPDHLKMGDGRMFKNTGDRGLYLLTNANQNNLSYTNNKSIYQIDLAKLILEGAEIKHNVKFLTDYIDTDKNDYINENLKNITSLNVSGFLRKELNAYVIPEISREYESYKKDNQRFIAHAGGKIDDYIYTNSLEAMNANYKKGFRLFELDLHLTTDNELVAVHNWEEWKTMTEYVGEVPTTKETFLKQKLYDKYTPLDIEAINQWFKNHPEAILITDKINEPKLVSEIFIDKSRLMMELFTWEAVQVANECKIKAPIASQTLIFSDYEKWKKLHKKNNIKHVAMSRSKIAANIALLTQLKKDDIKVYLYNVNYEIDKDEDYVVKYELDYAYGLYADQWNFNSLPQ